MAFVKIGAAVHHYVDEGAKDKPALLFANSLGSDLRMWDRWCRCWLGLSPHSLRFARPWIKRSAAAALQRQGSSRRRRRFAPMR
jgi:pimeloyl-ACP methyl ester carboxylesterase